MNPQRRSLLLAAALCALCGNLPALQDSAPKRRSLEITENIRLDLPKGAKELRLWIPAPPSDEFQSAEIVALKAPWPYRRTTEPKFKNQGYFLEARAPKAGEADLQFQYRVTRREQSESDTAGAPADMDKAPHGLVVITDQIKKISAEQTNGITDPIDRAHALYRYVLAHMAYDKTGKGWGRGDVVYACQVGKGNCTDFHSLFIALSIASGIPARFRMGYPVPDGRTGEIEAAYHCWAEFHVDGKGWIPVDISEAWKHREKSDYYFGHLDENRVLMTTGREIVMEPPQKSTPLNFWSQPYVEVDGKPLKSVVLTRSFQEAAADRNLNLQK